MADGKLVALTRIKAGGKYYEIGDDVSKLDGLDSLKEQGAVGTSSDLKKQQKEPEPAPAEDKQIGS
jgi:hypothetical protein